MTQTTEVDFSVWNKMDIDLFLKDDRGSEPRQAAAALIAQEVERLRGQAQRKRKVPMMEVGPGNGFDYADYFQHNEDLAYQAVEGSEAMVDWCLAHYPKADIRPGDFSTLKGKKWAITYAKAVFEHQPDFRPGLRTILTATKSLCVINWYLPPGAIEEIRFNEGRNLYSNRCCAADVLAVIEAKKFSCEIQNFDNGNAVYILRRL